MKPPTGQVDYSALKLKGYTCLDVPPRNLATTKGGSPRRGGRYAPPSSCRRIKNVWHKLADLALYTAASRMPASLRPVVWLACVCLLLGAHTATASELHVRGDLDGDGKHDRITLDRSQPTILKVWLSASHTTWTVRSRTPIVRVALSDLDGDNRPELITRGKEPGLTVWTRKKHQGFKRFRPRHNERPSIARTAPRALPHHGPESSSGAASSGSSALGLLIASRPRAPAPRSIPTVGSPFVGVCRSVVLAVFAPRPPPAFA